MATPEALPPDYKRMQGTPAGVRELFANLDVANILVQKRAALTTLSSEGTYDPTIAQPDHLHAPLPGCLCMCRQSGGNASGVATGYLRARLRRAYNALDVYGPSPRS